MRLIHLGALVLLTLPLGTEPILGQGSRVDLGLRYNVLAGDGEPTNDVLGYGLFGHYRLNDRWSIGFGVDRSDEFDVERAANLVGLVQDPNTSVVDNKADSTTLKGWIERSYRPERRLQWFWLVGVGLADINVDDAVGELAEGGSFNVAIDAGSQLVLDVGAGLRFGLGGNWFGEAVLRVEQHFADWDLVDVRSGTRGRVDDYTLTGIHFGFGYRFE